MKMIWKWRSSMSKLKTLIAFPRKKWRRAELREQLRAEYQQIESNHPELVSGPNLQLS